MDEGDLTTQQKVIVNKLHELKESLPGLEAQKRDLENRRQDLLAKLVLESTPESEKELTRIEKEIKLITQRIEGSTLAAKGLGEKLLAVEQAVRIEDKLKTGIEGEYVAAMERCGDLSTQAVEIVEEINHKIKCFFALVDEYEKLTNLFKGHLGDLRNFMAAEKIDGVSDRLTLENLKNDEENWPGLDYTIKPHLFHAERRTGLASIYERR